MIIIVKTLLLFLNIIFYIIFIDVILSWLSLVWIKRPRFIAETLDPIYNFIKKFLPTTFAGFDFVPIIVVLIIYYLQYLLLLLILK